MQSTSVIKALYFPNKYPSPYVSFYPLTFIVIWFYRARADPDHLTLTQPSFSEFPLHEDAYGQSCLHKSLVHVHKEVKLQSAFSLGSKKLFVTKVHYIFLFVCPTQYQHILDANSCIFNQKAALCSRCCWHMRSIVETVKATGFYLKIPFPLVCSHLGSGFAWQFWKSQSTYHKILSCQMQLLIIP